MLDEKLDLTKVKWIVNKYGYPTPYYPLPCVSVSTILSEMIEDPEFDEWVRKMGKEKVDAIMKAAGDRGTAMHTFIEHFVNTYAKTKDVSVSLSFTQIESPKKLIEQKISPEKIIEGREMFYKFYYSEYSNKFTDLLSSEYVLYSPSLFYRGKTDVIYKDKLYGLAITDYKTSSDFIKKGSVKEYKYKCQLGGYGAALDELYKHKNVKVNKCSILCVNTKSEMLQEIEIIGTELEEYKEKFKTLAQNYHIRIKEKEQIKNNLNEI